MRGRQKSMTFKQVKKIKSKTDWKRVRKEEPDMTDPDAPDFSVIMAKEVKKMGRPKKAVCKKMVNLRLDHFTLTALRQSGKGWQTRVSDWITEGVRRDFVLK